MVAVADGNCKWLVRVADANRARSLYLWGFNVGADTEAVPSLNNKASWGFNVGADTEAVPSLNNKASWGFLWRPKSFHRKW